MNHPKNSEYKVSQSELDALRGVINPLIYGGVDRFYKWRMGFIFFTIIFVAIRTLLSINTASVASALNALGLDITNYYALRVAYTAVVIALYAYSYCRDWFFPQVALVVFALGLGALIMDFFNIHFFYPNGLPADVVVAIVLRSIAIVCLFFNALNVHRAPAMPRRPWS